ncbi:MAG: hypothetical protein ACK52I_29300 [Pseudomonadota bacterium]
MNFVTLYWFELANEAGAWERRWSMSRAEAEEERAHELAELGDDANTDPDNWDGSYGDISTVHETRVPLTLEGVFHFANEYAHNTGDC